MVVVPRTRNGAYRLAELDGTALKVGFASFRIVPYHVRSSKSVLVTQFVNPADLSR